jgi:hypothetical protein
MEILRIEKLRPPSLDPFRSREPLALGATAGTAAVVSDPSFATAVALFDMASERRRSAALDGKPCRQIKLGFGRMSMKKFELESMSLDEVSP